VGRLLWRRVSHQITCAFPLGVILFRHLEFNSREDFPEAADFHEKAQDLR
jgi:hypothetical protein